MTASEQQTEQEGARLAKTLQPGAIVTLTGPLGSGKTAFVRGMAAGLGIDPRLIHSPSFTIVSEHPTASGGRLVHVDLYRLDSPREIEDLGLAECIGAGALVAVEWGEKLPERMRAGAVRVTLEDAGGDNRILTYSSW